MPTISTSRNGELPEYPISGPFGGIQSEMPLSKIGQFGFSDALNFMFRLGAARMRPKFYTDNAVIPAMPGGATEPWLGFADFFNANGVRQQVALTPTRMFYYDSGAWTELTGILTGSAGQLFSFAVCGQKLCFTQDKDPVQLWDGIGATYAAAAAGAVPAKYLFELANHLMVLNCVVTGAQAYQRVYWTGAGDPTDWTSFNAGQTDLFNDLGPINGGIKLGAPAYGYILQQLGIVQVIPTGIGTAPFYFNPMSSRSKGLIAPYSLAANGLDNAPYVGTDNVYIFDGNSSRPIGDAPISGSRSRMGARTRIFADLMQADLNTVIGFVSTSINGNPFNAYWLCIPNTAIWIYSFDEGNWTRFSINGSINCINLWTPGTSINWANIIGTWAQQTKTWEALGGNSAFDSVAIGFADGTSAYFDFTGQSEQAASLTTGQLSYDDPRHESATKKLRIIYKDNGESTIGVTLTNELGQTDTNSAVVLPGSNTGLDRSQVVGTSLPGNFITVQVNAAAGQTTEIVEISPEFSPAGEVKTVTA